MQPIGIAVAPRLGRLLLSDPMNRDDAGDLLLIHVRPPRVVCLGGIRSNGRGRCRRPGVARHGSVVTEQRRVSARKVSRILSQNCLTGDSPTTPTGSASSCMMAAPVAPT